MLPMISNVEEIKRARSLINRDLTHLRRHGHALPTIIKFGIMIEVPSLLFCLDEVMEWVDFVSVGTNDLHQFIFASDRANVALDKRYDTLSLPFLKILAIIIQTCQRHGRKVTLCGEMAGKPLEAAVLSTLGYHTLSMALLQLDRLNLICAQLICWI